MDWKEGDLVWAKVRGFPWWPGQVMDPKKATEKARAREKPGRVLIAFAGDGSFNWLLPKDIQSFGEHYAELKGPPNLSKALEPSFHLAVEEMKEVLDKRQGLTPATNHQPIDFLDGSYTADEEEGDKLPPTPDATLLRSCSAAGALAWLRAAAATLSEDGAGLAEGEGAAAKPEELVASARAQILGLKKKLAKPSTRGGKGEAAEGGTAGKKKGRWARRAAAEEHGEGEDLEGEKPTHKKGAGKAQRRSVGKTPQAAAAAAAAGGSGKKRGRPKKVAAPPDEGEDEEWEGPEAAEDGGGAAAATVARPKRARRPSALAKEAAPPDTAETLARPAARQRAPGQRWPLPGGWDTVAASLAALKALAAAGGRPLRAAEGTAVEEAQQQEPGQPEAEEAATAPAADVRAVEEKGGAGVEPASAAEGKEAAEAAPAVAEGEAAQIAEAKAAPAVDMEAAPVGMEAEEAAMPAGAEGEAAAEAGPAVEGEAAPADHGEAAPPASAASEKAEGAQAAPSAAAPAPATTAAAAVAVAVAGQDGLLSPVAAVALLRAREVLFSGSSLRQGYGAGPVLMSALAEAKVLFPARRGRKKGGGAASPAAAEELEAEAELEAEEESGSGSEGDDWAPRSKWKSGGGRSGEVQDLPESESEGEEEEGEEEEGGAGGKKQHKQRQGRKAEGKEREGEEEGEGGRRRGGRVKGGVPCEAPEVGEEARTIDYKSKVPATREEFDAALAAFYAQHKCSLVVPKIDKEQVDLFKVFQGVAARGGFEAVTARREWREVGLTWREDLGPTSTTQLRNKYQQYLLAFEQRLQEGCPVTTFKTPAGGRGRSGGKRELSSPSAPSGEAAPAYKKAKKTPAEASPRMAAAAEAGPGAGAGQGAGAEEGEGKGGKGLAAGSTKVEEKREGKVEQGEQGPPPAAAPKAAPARLPLIPRKAAPPKAAGASGRGEGTGHAKTVIKLRFPKEYGLPSQATIQTKLSTFARLGAVKSTQVYAGFKSALVIFEREEDAERCFNSIHEKAGQLFQLPAASVEVVWEEEKEKQKFTPGAPPPQQAQQAEQQQQQQQMHQPMHQAQQHPQPAQQAAWPAQQGPMASAPIYTAQQALPQNMMGMGYALMAPLGFGLMAQQAQQSGAGLGNIPQDPRRALAPAGPSAAGGGAAGVFNGVQHVAFGGEAAGMAGQAQQGLGQPMQLYSNAPPQLEAPSGMDLMNILQAAGVAPTLAPNLLGSGAAASAPHPPQPQRQLQPLLSGDAGAWEGGFVGMGPAAGTPAAQLGPAPASKVGPLAPAGEGGGAQAPPVDDYSTQLMALLGQVAAPK